MNIKNKSSADLGKGSIVSLPKTNRDTTLHSPNLTSFNYVVETAVDNSISFLGGEQNPIEFGSMNCIYDNKDAIVTNDS